MGEISPSRIEPMSQGSEGEPEDRRRRRPLKPPAQERPAVAPPPVEAEKEDAHQVDEMA